MKVTGLFKLVFRAAGSFFAVLMILLLIYPVQAAPIRVDNSELSELDGTGMNNGRRIVRDSQGFYHLVFTSKYPASDASGNPPETAFEEGIIYYTRTLIPAEGGSPPPWTSAMWKIPVPITSTADGAVTPIDDRYPSIAIEYGMGSVNERLHVVWQRERSVNGVYDIAYTTCSNDGSCAWEDGTGGSGHRFLYQSNTASVPVERNSLVPSIAINQNNHVHVTWQEENYIQVSGNDEYYSEVLYKGYTQGSSPTRDAIWFDADDYSANISQTPFKNSQMPSIACILGDAAGEYNSTQVHIAWNDDENNAGSGGASPNIWYTSSLDDGATWNSGSRENWSAALLDGGADGYPSLVIDTADMPHVVFMHGVSTDDPDGTTFNGRDGYAPGIEFAFPGQNPYPGPDPGLYQGAVQSIYYANSIDPITVVSDGTTLDNEFPSIALDSDGNQYVVWQGLRPYSEVGDYDIFFSDMTTITNTTNDTDYADSYPCLAMKKTSTWIAGYGYTWTKYSSIIQSQVWFDGEGSLIEPTPDPSATATPIPTPTPLPPDQSQYFVQNQSNMGNLNCCFYNLTENSVDVSVNHYYQSGILYETNYLTLLPRETRTLDVATEWGLPSGNIWGVTAFGTDGFSMLVAPDRIEFASPTSASIHPQGLIYTDSWWGMYNPPSNGYQGWDFFYIFNPNPVSAIPVFSVYDTDGTFIRNFTVNLDPFETEQVYLRTLPEGQGIIDYTNVGIHMVSSRVQCINVYTCVGSTWTGTEYSKHSIADGFVPFPTNHNGTELMWEQEIETAGGMVTNVTGTAADITLYGWNQAGEEFIYTGTVPARGSLELPPPTDIDGDGPFNYKLVSTQPLAAHAPYNGELVSPEVTSFGQTSFMWGLNLSGTGGGSKSGVGLFNPTGDTVTVNPIAYYYSLGTLYTQDAPDLTLGPHSADRMLYSSIFSLPSGVDNMTMHFAGDGNFGCLVEGPNMADAEPLIGGDIFQTYGLMVYPNHPDGWALAASTQNYLHTVMNDGMVPDGYFILPPDSTQSWTWTYYAADGGGQPFGTPITSIPSLGPSETFDFVAVLSVPPAVPVGVIDVTTHYIQSQTVIEFSDTCVDITEILEQAPTATPTPDATLTALPSWTPTNTPTSTPTPTTSPLPTDTPYPTWTPWPTWTQAPTWTPFPTYTPTPEPSNTLPPTMTYTPTITPTPPPTPTRPPTWTPNLPTYTPTPVGTYATHTPTSPPSVIRVPDDYPTIQSAIDAASHDGTVVVSDGVYTGAGNKNLDFRGKLIKVMSQDGPDNCIIDCEGSGRGFYFFNNEYRTSKLQGFTIRNGGGYITYGTGIYIINSSPSIWDCIITGNDAGTYGGGIYVEQNASPLISDCEITDNTATYGGGVYCKTNSQPIISNCVIYNNTAAEDGGGLYAQINSDVQFQNCIMFGNISNYGAAIFSGSSILNVYSCTITDNTAIISGGGYYCTVGISPEITQSILWGDLPDEIAGPGTPGVFFCDVETTLAVYPGEGNLNTNPLFINGPRGNYYLSQVAAGQVSESPCVNAGQNDANNYFITLPYGYVFMNQLTTRTDELNDYGIVDLGYHYFTDTFVTPTPSATPIPIPSSSPMGISFLLISISILIILVSMGRRTLARQS